MKYISEPELGVIEERYSTKFKEPNCLQKMENVIICVDCSKLVQNYGNNICPAERWNRLEYKIKAYCKYKISGIKLINLEKAGKKRAEAFIKQIKKTCEKHNKVLKYKITLKQHIKGWLE